MSFVRADDVMQYLCGRAGRDGKIDYRVIFREGQPTSLSYKVLSVLPTITKWKPELMKLVIA